MFDLFPPLEPCLFLEIVRTVRARLPEPIPLEEFATLVQKEAFYQAKRKSDQCTSQNDKIDTLVYECAIWNSQIFRQANQLVVISKHNSVDGGDNPGEFSLCFPHTLLQFPVDTWDRWAISTQQIAQKLLTTTALSMSSLYELLNTETKSRQLIRIQAGYWVKDFLCVDLSGMDKLVYTRKWLQGQGTILVSSLLKFDENDVGKLPFITRVQYPAHYEAYTKDAQRNKYFGNEYWDLLSL